MTIKSNFWRFISSVVVCFSAAALGSISTASAVTGWYLTIHKPSWTPPSWLFGPVWTLLYLLMAISLYLVWSKGVTKKTKTALNLFFVQLGLNLIWSLLFFGLANFWSAYLEVVALWIFIFLTIKNFRKISSTAAWLMVPYLLWVSFASFLNLAVAMLN